MEVTARSKRSSKYSLEKATYQQDLTSVSVSYIQEANKFRIVLSGSKWGWWFLWWRITKLLLSRKTQECTIRCTSRKDLYDPSAMTFVREDRK
jgi:hypothetical protein